MIPTYEFFSRTVKITVSGRGVFSISVTNPAVLRQSGRAVRGRTIAVHTQTVLFVILFLVEDYLRSDRVHLQSSKSVAWLGHVY